MNQFTVIEDNHNRCPDILLFINGLPLVVIELTKMPLMPKPTCKLPLTNYRPTSAKFLASSPITTLLLWHLCSCRFPLCFL
ncbi:MAG: hypothetical protein KME43_08350 [Myxacorys chilensis ATA2-1-KO14]|nr:hypothetical protein [Myxacorys chilensis ATA2-1-KO14]